MLDQFIGYTCWKVERVGQVINREAVEMDAATFLATHLPITGLRYEIAEYAITDNSENALLSELIDRAQNNKHTFVVLKGIPGTGKSHLVRWLRERYASSCEEQNLQEVTLLIRRANSSLRETLKQIIRSGVFEGPEFESYLQRLEDATNNLSSRELGNRLLNALQEAALAVREGTYKPNDRKYSLRVTKDMPDFLLNTPARSHLQRPGGGIERIVQFLSGEGRSSGAGEEMPQFEEADFDFPPEMLRDLRQSGGAIRGIADFSTTRRDDLVSYTNALLNRAVSNLTSITPEQLKAMFGELRRQLRRQGRNLTLFIEDITAFTGLDAGLIDVLIAQHGADNPEFCRLTSLIGVTDNYYEEQFRSHVRERITFLISLNTGETTDHASSLLQSSNNVVEMAARYLNAIRLPHNSVEEWHRQHASPDRLPNACVECPVRELCHESFGAVQVNANPDSAVGLYPFNERALVTLYENINPQRTTRTPRALLNNILSYILSSHTDRIRARNFPPGPSDLAPDVTPPNLKKPAQRQIIERAARSKRKSARVETLIRFWGDGTVDSPEDAPEIVGSLSRTVFDVFELPFFTGDLVAPDVESIPSDTGEKASQPSETVTTAPTKSPNADDIEQWRTGGRLQKYQQLAADLAAFVKSAIPWELHGISRTLVDERVTQARFEIQGQAGMARSRPRFTFERSDELALVLHALDDLRHIREPASDQLATNLTSMHSWLAINETRLIDYVKGVGFDDVPDELPAYDSIVTESVYALAALSGRLSKQQAEPLLKELIDFAAKPGFYPTGDDIRTSTWNSLLKGLLGDRPTPLTYDFLTMLNCPQGSSGQVRFIDAARGLVLLRQINRAGCFTSISFPEVKSSAWSQAVNIHSRLIGEAGRRAHQEEMESIQELRSSLTSMLGGKTPSDVLRALKQFQDRAAGDLSFAMETVPRFTIRRIDDFLETDTPVFSEDLPLEQWRYLAGILEAKKETTAFYTYVDQVSSTVEKDVERIERELEIGSDGNITVLRQKIGRILQEISQTVDDLLKSREA